MLTTSSNEVLRTLKVGGSTILVGYTELRNALKVDGRGDAYGIWTFYRNVKFNQDVIVGGNLSVFGDEAVGGQLEVTGNLTVKGESFLKKNVTVGDMATPGVADQDLTCWTDASVYRDLVVGSTALANTFIAKSNAGFLINSDRVAGQQPNIIFNLEGAGTQITLQCSPTEISFDNGVEGEGAFTAKLNQDVRTIDTPTFVSVIATSSTGMQINTDRVATEQPKIIFNLEAVDTQITLQCSPTEISFDNGVVGEGAFTAKLNQDVRTLDTPQFVGVIASSTTGIQINTDRVAAPDYPKVVFYQQTLGSITLECRPNLIEFRNEETGAGQFIVRLDQDLRKEDSPTFLQVSVSQSNGLRVNTAREAGEFPTIRFFQEGANEEITLVCEPDQIKFSDGGSFQVFLDQSLLVASSPEFHGLSVKTGGLDVTGIINATGSISAIGGLTHQFQPSGAFTVQATAGVSISGATGVTISGTGIVSIGTGPLLGLLFNSATSSCKITGNTTVQGSLTVNGSTTFNGTLTVSSLTVNGSASANSLTITTSTTTNSLTVNTDTQTGTISVTGQASAASLNISGQATLGSAQITGDMQSATANVTGQATLGSAQVSGDTATNTLNASGAANVGSLSSSGNISGGSLDVTGGANVGSVTATGSGTFNSLTSQTSTSTNTLTVNVSCNLANATATLLTTTGLSVTGEILATGGPTHTFNPSGGFTVSTAGVVVIDGVTSAKFSCGALTSILLTPALAAIACPSLNLLAAVNCSLSAVGIFTAGGATTNLTGGVLATLAAPIVQITGGLLGMECNTLAANGQIFLDALTNYNPVNIGSGNISLASGSLIQLTVSQVSYSSGMVLSQENALLRGRVTTVSAEKQGAANGLLFINTTTGYDSGLSGGDIAIDAGGNCSITTTSTKGITLNAGTGGVTSTTTGGASNTNGLSINLTAIKSGTTNGSVNITSTSGYDPGEAGGNITISSGGDCIVNTTSGKGVNIASGSGGWYASTTGVFSATSSNNVVLSYAGSAAQYNVLSMLPAFTTIATTTLLFQTLNYSGTQNGDITLQTTGLFDNAYPGGDITLASGNNIVINSGDALTLTSAAATVCTTGAGSNFEVVSGNNIDLTAPVNCSITGSTVLALSSTSNIIQTCSSGTTYAAFSLIPGAALAASTQCSLRGINYGTGANGSVDILSYESFAPGDTGGKITVRAGRDADFTADNGNVLVRASAGNVTVQALGGTSTLSLGSAGDTTFATGLAFNVNAPSGANFNCDVNVDAPYHLLPRATVSLVSLLAAGWAPIVAASVGHAFYSQNVDRTVNVHLSLEHAGAYPVNPNSTFQITDGATIPHAYPFTSNCTLYTDTGLFLSGRMQLLAGDVIITTFNDYPAAVNLLRVWGTLTYYNLA